MKYKCFCRVIRNCGIIFISVILVALITEKANAQDRLDLPISGVGMLGQRITEDINVQVGRYMPRVAMPASREKVGDYVPPTGFISDNIHELATNLRSLIREYVYDINSLNDIDNNVLNNQWYKITPNMYSDNPIIDAITPQNEINFIHLYRINRFLDLEAQGQNVLENHIGEHFDNPILATILPQMFSYYMLIILLEFPDYEGIKKNMAYHVDVLVENNCPHAYNISRALNILDGYWEKDRIHFMAKETIQNAQEFLGEYAPGIRELEKILDQ